MQRLKESAEVIRRLWSGERVYHRGAVTVEGAKLYSLPEEAPLLIAAALSEATAEAAGGWADGMITTSGPAERLRGMIEAFRRGGGAGKLLLKFHISYSQSPGKGEEGAWEQWRSNLFPSSISAELETPAQFDALSDSVRKEELHRNVLISSAPEDFVRRIKEFREMGFSEIYLHNVNREQEEFIDDFGRKVLPRVLQC